MNAKNDNSRNAWAWPSHHVAMDAKGYSDIVIERSLGHQFAKVNRWK